MTRQEKARQLASDAEYLKKVVTWACLTLRHLGVPFEREDGAWYICTFWGWEVCDSAREIASVARECLAFIREMNAVEGPIALA